MRPMAEGKAFPGMRILPPRADHRKASLSSAERAELQAARDVPELAPEANVARQAQMAADGGVSERIGWSKGGLQHAIARGHVRETGLTTDEFARAAEDIANSPIGTMANPGGGTRAYGLINGPYFEPKVMRVVIGRNGGIITAFVDKGVTPIWTQPTLREILLSMELTAL